MSVERDVRATTPGAKPAARGAALILGGFLKLIAP